MDFDLYSNQIKDFANNLRPQFFEVEPDYGTQRQPASWTQFYKDLVTVYVFIFLSRVSFKRLRRFYRKVAVKFGIKRHFIDLLKLKRAKIAYYNNLYDGPSTMDRFEFLYFGKNIALQHVLLYSLEKYPSSRLIKMIKKRKLHPKLFNIYTFEYLRLVQRHEIIEHPNSYL